MCKNYLNIYNNRYETMNDDDSTGDERIEIGEVIQQVIEEIDHESTDDDWTDVDSDNESGDERTAIEIGEVIHQDIEEIDIESINDLINDSPDSMDINYNSIKEFCPVVNSRDMDYELNNKLPNGYIKCKNYELCLDTLWVKPFKSNYLCYDCDITYKKQLEIKENVECPICLEIKRGVIQPNCSHFTCVDCFKLCYYCHEIDEPKFPYPDLEDEYDDDINNSKWVTDYPLIKPYWAELRKYNSKIKEKKKKKFLKICPLCRN